MSPSKTVLETGTTAHTTESLGSPCVAIGIVSDTIFTTLTGVTGDALTAVTFPAGMIIYGNFSAVTLTSGSVLLYLL